MNTVTKFSLFTSLVCATFGYSSTCWSPYVIASDGDINYQNCTACNCNAACDYLGAIYAIGASSGTPSEVSLILYTNYATPLTCGDTLSGPGNTITLNGGSNTLALDLTPMGYNTYVSTNNSTSLIETTNNPSNYPAIFFVGATNGVTSVIDSGITYQNSVIWVGEYYGVNQSWTGEVTLQINGVNNGVNQWSGNTFVLNYVNNGSAPLSSATIVFAPGTMGSNPYPTNYADNFQNYGGVAYIENSGTDGVVTLNGILSDYSSTNPSIFDFTSISGGQLNLTGRNTYSGGTVLSGNIGISNGSAFGTGTSVGIGAVNPTTIQILESNFTLGNFNTVFTLIDTLTLDLNAQSFTLEGTVSQTSSSATLVVLDSSGTNSGIVYMGADISGLNSSATYQGGTVVVSSTSNFTSGTTILDGGTIGLGTTSAVVLQNTINLNGNGYIDVFGNGLLGNFNFAGTIGNDGLTTGNLHIINSRTTSGSVLLSGQLTYTGTTSITSPGGGAVEVILNQSGANPSLATSEFLIDNLSTLTVESAASLPPINNSTPSYTGSLALYTSSKETVTINSTYLNQLMVPATGFGNLALANSAALNVNSVQVTGTLQLIGASTIVNVVGSGSSILGTVSGTGGFSVASSGTLSISSLNNTFSGGIYLDSGATLVAGGKQCLGTGVIQSNGATFVSNIGRLSTTQTPWSLNGGTTTFSCGVAVCSVISLGPLSVNGATAGIHDSSGAGISFTSLNVPFGQTLEITSGTSGVLTQGFGVGSGTIVMGGTLKVSSKTPQTFSGSLQGSGPLDVSASLTLSGSNSFIGGIILQKDGNLQVSSTSNLGSSSQSIYARGGNFTALSSMTVTNPFVLENGESTFGGTLTLSGNVSVPNVGAKPNNAVIATATNSSVVFNFSNLDVASNASLSTNGHNITVNNLISGTGKLKLGGLGSTAITDTFTINSVGATIPIKITDAGKKGKGAVVITGNVAFTATNTYSGGTTLQNGSTVTIGSNQALGSGTIYSYGTEFIYESSGLSLSGPQSIIINPSVANPTTTFSCSTSGCSPAPIQQVSIATPTSQASATIVNATGNFLTIQKIIAPNNVDLYLNGGSQLQVSSLTTNSSNNLYLAGLLLLSNSSTLTIGANINDYPSEDGTLELAGPVVFSGNNTFSGNLFLNGGSMSISSLSNIPTSGTFTCLANGTLINTASTRINVTSPWILGGSKNTLSLQGSLEITGSITVENSSIYTLSTTTTSGVSTVSFSLPSLDIGTGGTLSSNNNDLLVTGLGSGQGTLNLGTATAVDTLTMQLASAGSCYFSIVGNGAVVVQGDVSFYGQNTFSSSSGLTLESGSLITGQSTIPFGGASSFINSYGGSINLAVCATTLPSLNLIAQASALTTTVNSSNGCSAVAFGNLSMTSSVAGSSAIFVNAGSDVLAFNTLQITNSTTLSIQTTPEIVINAFGSGTGNLFLSGPLNVNNSQQKQTAYSGNIFDYTGGAGSIIVNSPLQLLGISSTFTGGVTLNNTLTIGAPASLGTGPITANGGGLVLSASALDNPWIFLANSLTTPVTTVSFSGRAPADIAFATAAVSGSSGGAAFVNNTGTVITFTTVDVPANTSLSLKTGSGITLLGTELMGAISGSGTIAIANLLNISGPGFIANTNFVDYTSSGSLGVDIAASDTLILRGNNTFSGSITLTSGTVQIGSPTNLSAASIVFDGGVLESSSILTLTLDNTLYFSSIEDFFYGDFKIDGAVNVTTNSSINSLSGVVTLNPSYLDVSNSAIFYTNGLDIDLAGPFGPDKGTIKLGSSTTTDTLTVDGSTATSFAGNIDDNNPGVGVVVVKSDLTLTGNNSFSGGLYINNAILNISNSSSTFGTGTIYADGGTIETTGNNQISNNIEITAGTTLTFNLVDTLTLKGTLEVNGGGTAGIYNTGNGTLKVEGAVCSGVYEVTTTLATVWDATNTCSTVGSSELFASFAETSNRLSTAPDSSVSITVIDGGILRGIGIVDNVNIVEGAIAAGTETYPNGIFTINSDLTLDQHSYYYVGINKDHSALTSVGGTAYIDGNSRVYAIPQGGVNGSYQHVILEASTIDGAFNEVAIVPEIAFLEAELLYDVPGQISMKVTALQISDSPIQGLNAKHVAKTLDELIAYDRTVADFVVSCCPPSVEVSETSTVVIPDLLISLRPFVGTAQMSDILNQLQPAAFKGLTVIQENNIVNIEKSIESRTNYLLSTTSCLDLQDQQNNSCCEKMKKTWELWADGLGATTSQKSNWYAGSPQVGYQSHMAGFSLGIDAHFAKYFYAGLMGGYTSSFVSFKSSRGFGNIQTGYGGVYFSAIGDMFYGNIHLVAGSNNLSGTRYISYGTVHEKAKHKNMGQQLLSHIDTGVNIDVGGWFKIKPFDDLDYISQKEDGYTEFGAADWNLKVGKKNSILLRNELGLELSSCLCFSSQKWVIAPRASWVREIRVKGGGYTASFAEADAEIYVPYTVQGYFPSRNLFSPAVTLTGSLCKDLLNLELHYRGEFTHGYSNQSFGGQVRVSF